MHIQQLNQSLVERDAQVSTLNQTVNERDVHIQQLNQSLVERDTQHLEMIDARDREILRLEQSFNECLGYLRAIEATLSWKMTRPIRFVRECISSIDGYVLKSRLWIKSITCASFSEAQEPSSKQVSNPPLELDPAFIALSGEVIHENATLVGAVVKDTAKLIAFYLPQFHQIAENSEWWGEGFTEWTNVKKALPNFEEHYQPHEPAKLGYYDLSSVQVMHEQAEMARLFGVHGFCFYYYWFSGRRVLERPLENFLKSDVDINFCLCWANENWTRTWDGDTKSVLLEQKYEVGDEEKFIEDLLPYFKDSRYIYVDGSPLLLVYRAKEIPNADKVFSNWRLLAKKYGFKNLHIVVVDFYDIQSPEEVGADALVEFPPHKFNGPNCIPEVVPRFTNANFSGGIIDYNKIIAQSANRAPPDFKLYRGLIPSWDNTARRQDNPTIVVNESPKKFGAWLAYIRAYTRKYLVSKEDNFIFINAWNEWGEGCHLEPDQKRGMGFLEETLRSAYFSEQAQCLDAFKEKLFEKIIKEDLTLNQEMSTHLSSEQLQAIQRLHAVRPQSKFVQLIKKRLQNHAALYSCARSLYKLIYRQPGLGG